MRTRRFLLLLLVVVVFAPLLVLLLLASGLIQREGKTWRTDYALARIFPPRESHGGPKVDRRRSFCASNLKQMALAVRMYEGDHAGSLPLVESANGQGWAEQLQPYLKTTVVYQCPQQGPFTAAASPAKTGYTDYWYNAHLSGQAATALASPVSTFLLGEGNDGTEVTDAHYSKTSLPPAWLSDRRQPPYRHLQAAVWAESGAMYVYVDGHVRWLKPAEVAAAIKQRNPFAIREES